MHKVAIETRGLVRKHDLDELLPSSAVVTEPAAPHDLADMLAIASQDIPGINSSEAGLADFLYAAPDSIFAFKRNRRLLGGIAFLYLNCAGHDALLLDEIDLKNPGRELLAQDDEEVSAIYVWALVGHGRAVAGLGNVATHLKGPRYIDADYFAQPATTPGRNLLIALGFEPTSSYQPDLWCYQRPWNRFPSNMPVSNVSPRSFADARQ
jgi:hypothetical protein